MKKFIAILLTGVLSVGLLTACGSNDNAGNSSPTTAPTTAAGQEENNVPESEGDISYTISDKTIADSYPAIATDGVDITDEICEDAIVVEGNQQRLARVMEKASNGEDITIAYIGGSITQGFSAAPRDSKCYAGLTQVWWDWTFQDCNINYVNAGIGATDSYIGVHRAAKDVLTSNPDLVVVEFSVNDTRDNNQETYESLLRELLNYETEPAVVALAICTKTSYYKDHLLVATKLDIPMISYAKVAQANMANNTWEWSQLGAADGTHPNNGGHSVIAHLLTYFYNKVLNSINETKYVEYEVPEDTVTLSRYENANILYSDEIDAIEMDGFTEVVANESSLFNKNGWSTTTNGTITFELEASNIGFIFWKTTDGKSGKFDVYVDDEYATTLNADFSGGWGNYAEYVEAGKFGDAAKHTVTIKPAEDSTATNLTILALTVS